MKFEKGDTVEILPGEFTDMHGIVGETGTVYGLWDDYNSIYDGYLYIVTVGCHTYVIRDECLRFVRHTDDKPFWESAVAFLYSERERHIEDIDAIDRKIYLIRDHHGIDIQSIMAADFLDEEKIKRKVKRP